METTEEIIEEMRKTNERITKKIIDLVNEQRRMINVLGKMISELLEDEENDSA